MRVLQLAANDARDANGDTKDCVRAHSRDWRHWRPLPMALVFLAFSLIAIAQQPQVGRQPAPVMGAAGADWLTRPERIQEEEPDRMLASLEIQPGSVVADVGAGVGYHAWRLSRIVGPAGRVIAEDIQEEMIRMLKQNIEKQGLLNVDMVLGTPTDPKLPQSAVDLVLMVDVYHEFSDPVAMMTKIRRALKPGGRVVLVEFRKEDPKVPIKRLHKMTEAQVRKEMAVHPLEWVETSEVLPRQHIIVFKKKVQKSE